MTFDLSKIEFEKFAVSVASAVVILVVGRMLASWACRLVERIGARSDRMSPTLVPLFAKIVRLGILALAFLSALEKVGVQTTSFLAVLGAAGLAIGLALKDTVSDVAAGVMLLVLRPFNVGDTVDIDGTTGTVDAIDLFQTRLTSSDGVPVMLNNSMVRTKKISNFSRASRRKIELRIGIGYESDIGHAKRCIAHLVAADGRIHGEPKPVVDVHALGDNAVILTVECWVTSSDLGGTKMDLTRAIKEGLDAEGIRLPHPQRDVHLIRAKTHSPVA